MALAPVAAAVVALGLVRPLNAEPQAGAIASLSAWLMELARREGIQLQGVEHLGDRPLPARLPLTAESLGRALAGVNHIVNRDGRGAVTRLHILARLPAAQVPGGPRRRGGDGRANLELRAPLAEFELASGFGLRADPFTGKPARHAGVDLAAPQGTPVSAAADGRVQQIARDARLGLFVRLDHGEGRQTLYGHLHDVAPGLTVGSIVAAGARLGRVGASGRATAAHLHFELSVDGRAVAPAFADGPGKAERATARKP